MLKVYTDLFDNFDIVVNPLPIASLDAEIYICDNPNVTQH